MLHLPADPWMARFGGRTTFGPHERSEKRAPACFLGFIRDEFLPNYVGIIMKTMK